MLTSTKKHHRFPNPSLHCLKQIKISLVLQQPQTNNQFPVLELSLHIKTITSHQHLWSPLNPTSLKQAYHIKTFHNLTLHKQVLPKQIIMCKRKLPHKFLQNQTSHCKTHPMETMLPNQTTFHNPIFISKIPLNQTLHNRIFPKPTIFLNITFPTITLISHIISLNLVITVMIVHPQEPID